MKFGYVRVSSRTQNPDLQVDALREFGVDKIFIDKMSGRSMDRPQFSEMMKYLRRGDTVVVWKLDRLGRTTKGLIELFDEFEKTGIEFVSLTEQIDTTTPMGKFIVTILAGFVQMEVDLNRERCLAGAASARARGLQGGRPKKDPEAVRMAITLYESKKYTFKEIQERTGVSKGTLYKYLREQRETAE